MSNGWPGEPGVPLNPERSGRHWANGSPDAFWNADRQRWAESGSYYKPADYAGCGYEGPLLTPAEIATQLAAARRAGLEEAARWHDTKSEEATSRVETARHGGNKQAVDDWLLEGAGHRVAAAAIRAIPALAPAPKEDGDV